MDWTGQSCVFHIFIFVELGNQLISVLNDTSNGSLSLNCVYEMKEPLGLCRDTTARATLQVKRKQGILI